MQTDALATRFMVITPELQATPITVTPNLYQQLDEQFNQFKSCLLVAEYHFKTDWPNWEMHPNGDEILYLVKGEAEFILLCSGEFQRVAFTQAGSTLVIPKGVWHTARTNQECAILFITPGEDTQHCDDPLNIDEKIS